MYDEPLDEAIGLDLVCDKIDDILAHSLIFDGIHFDLVLITGEVLNVLTLLWLQASIVYSVVLQNTPIGEVAYQQLRFIWVLSKCI